MGCRAALGPWALTLGVSAGLYLRETHGPALPSGFSSEVATVRDARTGPLLRLSREARDGKLRSRTCCIDPTFKCS